MSEIAGSVLRQNKRVLLYTFVKNQSLLLLCVHSIYLSLLASRIIQNMEFVA